MLFISACDRSHNTTLEIIRQCECSEISQELRITPTDSARKRVIVAESELSAVYQWNIHFIHCFAFCVVVHSTLQDGTRAIYKIESQHSKRVLCVRWIQQFTEYWMREIELVNWFNRNCTYRFARGKNRLSRRLKIRVIPKSAIAHAKDRIESS